MQIKGSVVFALQENFLSCKFLIMVVTIHRETDILQLTK